MQECRFSFGGDSPFLSVIVCSFEVFPYLQISYYTSQRELLQLLTSLHCSLHFIAQGSSVELEDCPNWTKLRLLARKKLYDILYLYILPIILDQLLHDGQYEANKWQHKTKQ